MYRYRDKEGQTDGHTHTLIFSPVLWKGERKNNSPLYWIVIQGRYIKNNFKGCMKYIQIQFMAHLKTKNG